MMTSKTATMDKSELWKFGNREIVNSAAGALLYAVLYWVFKAFSMPIPIGQNIFLRPGVLVPLFMGLMYGPWVGGLTGLAGHVVGDLLAASGFNLFWAVGSGLMGFIPGLSLYLIREYETLRDYALAELFVLLGAWGGAAFGALVGGVLILRQSDFAAGMSILVSEGLTTTLNGVLLVPALILIWNAYRGGNAATPQRGTKR
jgi:energy-coupling factor transport system substrate-specific component